MTRFTAAAASALHQANQQTSLGLYSFATEAQFELKRVDDKAPALLCRLLKLLRAKEETMVFFDGAGAPINVDEFPSDKSTFDEIFSTFTKRDMLYCRFEIRSTRKSFHEIKLDAWNILEPFKIWLRRSPGPIEKLPLTAMGFWINVHPTFAQPHAWLDEIKISIEDNYPDADAAKKLNLPEKYKQPDNTYISRSRVSGQYHDTDDDQDKAIDADVLMMYANSDDYETSMTMVTQVSYYATPKSTTSPMFIPIGLKKSDPTRFGYYLAQHNQFMKTHRNIAIVGVSSELMDFKIDGTSLWKQIRMQPGVYRCDPCDGTSTIGKWNISSSYDHNLDIKTWLYETLSKWSQAAPKDFPTFTTFPTPEVLSKDRRPRSSPSVASGLTDASPIENYMRKLDNRLTTTTPPLVQRSAWQTYLPVEQINYSFNLDDFPTLPTDARPDDDSTAKKVNQPPVRNDATATTAASTTTPTTHGGAATAVSGITEDMVSTMVKNQISAFTKETDEQHKALQARMDALDNQIAEMSQHIDKISDRLADTVIQKLTAPTGILTTHKHKLDEQAKATAKLMDMISTLTSNVKRITTVTDSLTAEDSPFRKKYRRSGSPLMEGDSTDNSDVDTVLGDCSIQQE